MSGLVVVVFDIPMNDTGAVNCDSCIFFVEGACVFEPENDCEEAGDTEDERPAWKQLPLPGV